MVTKKENDTIEYYLIMDKEFDYISDVCKTYNVRYDMKLIDQILDRYNYWKTTTNSNYEAKRITLSGFLEAVKEQNKRLYK